MPGQTLFFLFNFSDRQLHGLYRASSAGQENLSPDAWAHAIPSEVSGAEDGESQGGGGEGSTPFPAQCRFEIVEEFMPLPEAECRHVLEYSERQRFKYTPQP